MLSESAKIKLALEEDIGKGDLTSFYTVGKQKSGKGVLISRSKGILAGLSIAEKVFKTLDKKIIFKPFLKDGTLLNPGQKLALVKGRLYSLLAAERTALNILQMLSGVATLTCEFVKKIQGTKAVLLDTRKTTPLLRAWEKYAVKIGGGQNHRWGLYDMILIKSNHLRACRSIEKTLAKIHSSNFEIEVGNLQELRQALNWGARWIMLDNFNLAQLKKAVAIVRKLEKQRKKKIKLEVSGGVNLKNVTEIARTGVDFISVGALTQKASALDISFKIF